MPTSPQKTIAREIILSGRGLHSGQDCRLTLAPAAGTDEGIIWQRTDLVGRPILKAGPAFCRSSGRGTDLVSAEAKILTIEHVMAALAGLGIDNLRIELDGPEPPILDGSARPFAEALLQSGLVEQNSNKKVLLLDRPVRIQEEGKEILVQPAERFEISYEIDFPGTSVGRQSAVWRDGADFQKDWAPARTFGFWFELEQLKAKGQALGASLDNGILVLQDGYSTELRFPDELVRHKIIDLLGDLKCLGCDLQARISARKAGHQLHLKLVQKLAGLILEEAKNGG